MRIFGEFFFCLKYNINENREKLTETLKGTSALS